MAEDDPVKIDGFGKMPVIEYWAILDKKIGEQKKAIAEANKQKAKARK